MNTAQLLTLLAFTIGPVVLGLIFKAFGLSERTITKEDTNQ